jgi:hypothetical protein
MHPRKPSSAWNPMLPSETKTTSAAECTYPKKSPMETSASFYKKVGTYGFLTVCILQKCTTVESSDGVVLRIF